jgi:Glycosyltransferase family 9 (heptosyltransferase)
VKLSIQKPTKLGDTILIEPAAYSYARNTGDRVELYVSPQFRCLYQNHPYIRLLDDVPADPDLILNSDQAYGYSIENCLPFGAGYYPQFGQEFQPGDRCHYQSFSMLPVARNRTTIALTPHSHCDQSRLGLGPANVEAPLSWWKPIVSKIKNIYKIDKNFPECKQYVNAATVCGENDECIPGSDRYSSLRFKNYRSGKFDDVLRFLSHVPLLVTVETGILHLASAAKVPTLFLSSATPPSFCRPDTRHEIVRADFPGEWSYEEIFAKMDRLLSENGYRL